MNYKKARMSTQGSKCWPLERMAHHGEAREDAEEDCSWPSKSFAHKLCEDEAMWAELSNAGSERWKGEDGQG